MNIDIDSLVIFIILWGIPTFLVVRAYLKMNSDDKKSAMKDFRTRRFIYTIGFVVIGAFMTHLGTLITLSVMKVMGIALLILGGFFTALDLWKKNKIKSMLILVLLTFIIFLNVS